MSPVLDNTFVPQEWYFAFYDRALDPLRWFGHCDAWGRTKDDTWVFIDPNRTGLQVQVAHIAEEVESLMASRIYHATEIIHFTAPRHIWQLPMVAPGTCASICGAAVGIRAWTPRQLRRKLLQNGGEIR